MPMRARRWVMVWVVCIAGGVAAGRAPAQGIPARLTDADFWQLMTTLSEPNGYFQSENLVSNETGFETVIPALARRFEPRAVYFGVGPEQNFTYIAALHPSMAFIIDIRHQNAMQHLLYKALMEMSDHRADFLSRLFSRPRPSGLSDDAPIDTLFAAYERVPADSALYQQTLDAIRDRLIRQHGFPLDSAELALVTHNFDAFYLAGPGLSYNFTSSFGGRGRMPTYADLMTAQDSAGTERSFLASEASYAAVRDLEARNLIVPLTGDFGGPRAVRAAGAYVRAHHAIVGAFYTSNVEQYLFREDSAWARFYASVATLPIDSTSTFIRSGGAGFRGYGGPGGMHTSLLQPIMQLLSDFAAQRVTSYRDVIAGSH